jgi:hypothetical protein
MPQFPHSSAFPKFRQVFEEPWGAACAFLENETLALCSMETAHKKLRQRGVGPTADPCSASRSLLLLQAGPRSEPRIHCPWSQAFRTQIRISQTHVQSRDSQLVSEMQSVGTEGSLGKGAVPSGILWLTELCHSGLFLLGQVTQPL